MLLANQQLLSLGKLKTGFPHKFKFVLSNKSTDKTDNITNITVGCGSCTQASCDKTEVAPGESTDINVVFTPSSTGVQLKSVTVQYKEGSNTGSLTLKFSAEVG